MAYDNQLIANKLRRCRNNNGLTIQQVVGLTGIPEERLISLETGAEPTGDEILILAEIYMEDFKYFISNQKLSSAETVEELYRQ